MSEAEEKKPAEIIVSDVKEAKALELDLRNTSKETLEVFIEESTDADLFKEILVKNQDREDVIRLLYEHPNTPDEVRKNAASALNLPVVRSEAEYQALRKSLAEQKAQEIQQERLIRKIGKMSVSEKIKLAMKGGSEARGILLKDSNKLVVMSVLDNPRITDKEIEAIARSRSIFEDALRAVARNREWMKSYSIQVAMITNPKTPPGISMQYVPYMKKKDLSMLEKNKNVPEVLRTTAKKLLKQTKT